MKTSSKYSKEILEKVISNNNSITGCLAELKIYYSNASYTYFKSLINKYNLDISHFLSRKELTNITLKKRGGSWRTQYTPEELFIYNPDKKINNGIIKKYLYKNFIKQPVCEMCGQDENWKTGKIPLILDHMNGNNRDNRIENLRIVCPNCDATLPTFTGRNKGKYKQELKNQQRIEKYNKKIEKINDIEKKLIENNINFSIKTWGVESSKLLGYSPQYCLKFIKTNLPHLIEKNISYLSPSETTL